MGAKKTYSAKKRAAIQAAQGGGVSMDTRSIGYGGAGMGPASYGYPLDNSGVTAPGSGGNGGRDIGDILGGIPGIGPYLETGWDIYTGLQPTQQQCPSGTIRVGSRCVSPGDAFPGGAPFITPAGGGLVNGMMGLEARVPATVGQINGGPILRCPRRYVLGEDDLCYHKSIIPRALRKWKPAPRPPITAGDAKAIRRAQSAQKRVKRLAGRVGFTCTTKGRARATTGRKKKC